MEGKGKPVALFNVDDWMCEFALIMDITTHVNELNTRLQGKDQLINSVFDHIMAFEIKFRLWILQLTDRNFIFQVC
jgi:hypothetical protein